MYNTVVDRPPEVADSPIGCNSPTPAVAPSGGVASCLPPKPSMKLPKPAVAPPPLHKPPDDNAMPLHREKSLSSTTSESDGSDSDDELPESMQPVCMQRNSKQNAVIGEFTPRLAQCKLPGIDSPTSESAPSEEVSPQLLTKKPSKDQAERKGTPEPLQDASPKPGAAPSEKAAPAVSPTQELSTRRVVWLMIKNIPEAEQTISLEFKNNDIVRWLDFDPKHLESEPASLPVDRYLECETWSGKPVVVPSEYARRISSTLELAQVLQRRPRAEVIEDFVGTGDDDLSVGAGEVIYLLFECDSTYFMAMNKGLTRGRVPKSVLNVLVAP